jgi:hypothetical protein
MGVKYTKKGLNVKKTLMITDSNQACITKMSGCGLQEGSVKKAGPLWTLPLYAYPMPRSSNLRDPSKSPKNT